MTAMIAGFARFAMIAGFSRFARVAVLAPFGLIAVLAPFLMIAPLRMLAGSALFALLTAKSFPLRVVLRWPAQPALEG
jgi:hypothetical protein